MGIEKIIAKHKEYLRKAQLDSLVKKSEAYKQAYAKPRHEALSQTQTQYEVSRRMLQNAGLASRRGNVVSGRENAIRAKLERFYRDYNAQLNNAAMERTEHDAQMMERDRQIAEQEASLQGALYRWRQAQQKAVRQQEQQTKKQQATQIATKAVDDVKKTIKEKVKLAKEKAVKRAAKEKGQWKERQTDTHGGVEKTPVKESDYTVAMKYAMSQGAGKAEAVSFATQYVSEKQKEERAALAESTRKSWVTQSTGKDEKDTTIAKKQVAAAERYITEHSQEWDTAISEARKATPRDSVAKMKGQRAQREKAQAMSEYARAQLAVSAPEEMEQLLLLPEKDFQQRYEAAVELVKKLRGDKQTMDVLRYDPQSGVDPLDHGESTDEMLKAATETLAQLERVQRLRTITSADSMMFETFKADKGNIPEAPTYAMLTDKDGKNIQRAFDSGWDASDYRRTHDTKGSKYAALINEWSYINGRTALNYTQTHGVAKILRSVRDTFTKGESESWRYDSFIGRCAAEFYHDPEEGGTKAQREQMESMLTLANLMTEDERARYNTILKQAGATEADKYFEYLYKNVLPERFDNYVNEEVDFQTRDAIGKVRESLMSVPMNMTQGISGPIYTLTSKQEDAVAAKLAAKKYDLAQGTRDRIGQQFGEVGSFLYGTGMSMVDSAVVAAISSGVGSALKGIGVAAGAASKIGSAVGGAILGGSAFNSTYNESLEKGLDPIKARATAIGSGINEMLFESLSIGTLLEVTGNETVKVAKNAFVNWIVNAAIQSGVEGSEEVFTDIGNRLWDNQVNKIFSEEQTKLREYIADGYTYDEAKKKVDDEFAQQLGASFGGGALSGFFMGGGAGAVSAIQTRSIDRLGKSLSAERIEDLKNFDYKSEEAKEILDSGKLTHTDAGMLEIIRTQELTQQSEQFIKEQVADGAMPKDVAETFDRFMSDPASITEEDAERMLPYVDTLKDAVAIRQGLNDIVREQRAARAEIEAMTPEQRQTKLEELGKVKGADSLRVTSREAGSVARTAASEYAQKVSGITVKGDRVLTPKGSVTFDFDGKTLDTMNDNQQRSLRFAASIATKTGSNIKLEQDFVGTHKGENGYYDYGTDTLHVNLSGDHSVVYTVSHELTHMLKEKNKQGYADLAKAVKEELSRSDLVGTDLPSEYQGVIGKFLTGDNTLFDALKAYEQSRDYGANAEEEVVARCCESFLSNEAFVSRMCQTNEKAASAIYKFVSAIRADIDAMRSETYERMGAKGYQSDYSPETGILEQFGDIDRIAKLWEKGLREVSKKRKAKTTPMDSVRASTMDSVKASVDEAIRTSGVATDTDGNPVLKVFDHGDGGAIASLSTYEQSGRAALEEWLNKRAKSGDITSEQRTYILDQMDKIYKIATEYEGKYASFGAWSRAEVTRDKSGKPVFSVIRANGEYPMNLDFSLVCVKRRALDAVLNEIVKSGYMDKLVLDGEGLVKINDIIRKRGFETACMGCFVEAKRFRQQGVAETFVQKYNELVKSLGKEASHFNFAKDETISDTEGIVNVPDKDLDFTRINELIKQYKDKKKANKRAGQTVEEAIAMELKMNPASRRLVDVGDFMSTRGMDAVAKDAPRVLSLYNKQKGTGGPKAVFGDMQYLNDIESKRWSPERAYKVGGVRVQSFSDFVPRMFFDYCQMVADLAGKKLPAHAYTKEESFVKLFGLTGMKINMSLFPKVANDGLAAGLMYQRDKNGDIVFKDGAPVITYAWAGESFDYEKAKEIQADLKYGKNCGTIAVGISDEHIQKLLDDPTIRMVIPYHKSSLNSVIAEMMHIDAFEDYTDQQRTYNGDKAVDVEFAFNQRLHEVGDPKAVTKEYLAWCEKNGYTPKFAKFKDNENYYKLLEDFSLYDEQGNYCPQEAVRMEYPSDMSELLDTYLKRDNDLQEARDMMIPALAKEIIATATKKDSIASKMDNIKLTETGEARTFEMGEVKARMYGNTVELEGGNIRQRVRMLQELAERYGEVTVDAASDEEADAFKRAGALRETELFSSGNTYSFEYKPSTYTTESKEDIRKKENFAKKILNEVGRTHIKSLSKHREELERAYRYMWNATHGKADQMAAYDTIDRMFDRILDDYSELPAEIEGAREALLKEMRVMRDGKGRKYRQLEVTPSQMTEIRHLYDSAKSYNVMLSKAFGTRVFIKEVQGASMLENMKLTDVAENAPSVLLEKAQEVGKTERTNPYAGTSDERTAMKDSMWDIAASLVGGEKSTAQQIREAVKEVRKSERATAKEKLTKAVDDARLAERMHEGALRAQDRRIAANRETELKRRMVDREARLKQQFRETTTKNNEAMLKRDMRQVALKWNQRLVKMLANPTEASHVPIQLAREVAELTKTITAFLDNGTERGRINLEKVMKAYQQAFDDTRTIAEAQKENPSYDPRGKVIDREMYDEHLVQMMDDLNTIMQGKSVKDLNVYEMKALLDIVRGVAHTVYDANRMIGTTERKAIWQVGDKMVTELETAPKVKGKMYLEEMLDLRRLAKIFSGSNENAEFVKLVDHLNKGAIEKERVAQVLKGMFDPLTKEYGEDIRKWYGKNAEWIDTGIRQNGRKVEITKGMRVSLAMHVLNAGNMRHIENGGVTIPDKELYAKGKLKDAYANKAGRMVVQLNADQINAIISQMTEAEKAYVEVAKEFFHQRTGYYVNKTSLQLLGYRKATVENYFPIHTNDNYTQSDFASVVRDGSIEGQGFLKERVMASNPVYLEDITSVVNRQIKGVSLYAGLAVPMRNFKAVMNAQVWHEQDGVWKRRTSVKETMTDTLGDYGTKVVQGFLQDVSGMSAVDVSPMEVAVAKMQTKYVKAVLLANLKVTLKQAASYPTAAAVIPWKYLSKALLKGGRNHRLISRADVDLINQYTPLYQMRREGNANEITSIMQEKGIEQKMPWLLGWITKMDVATVGRLWSACEYMIADQQKNLPVGSDAYYKAVAKVFNDTIQQTQPNFTPLQRNAALRSKNPVVRTLTLFGTQRMQNGGLLIESAMELKHAQSPEARKAAKAKFGRVVVSQLVQNAMLVAIGFAVDALRGRMRSWQDDDKEITTASIAKYMGDQFLGNIFGSFLGGSEAWDIVSTAYKRATNADAYDSEFTVPALDAIESIVGFANKDSVEFFKYIAGDHSAEEKLARFKSFSFKIAKAAGYATGFPFENIAKTIVKGWIPMAQDIYDAVQTGELIPYLHQSGKLDKAKTAANYKEWTKAGYSGRDYFVWEKKLSSVTGGREGRMPVLLDSDLTNEQKAMLMQMFDTSEGYAEGTKFFNKKGELQIDFAEPTEKQLALPMPEETAAPTSAPTSAQATPEPTKAPLSDAKMQGVQEAVKAGVNEQTAIDAFLAYQDIGKQTDNDDDWNRNDQFREWLFRNVESPEQRAVLEYQVIGQAARVDGAVTYRESGTVYRDYTNESWFKLSAHNLAKDGTNKRYDAGKKLELTGLPVDKTVAIYEGLAQYTKKAEWTKFLKEQGLTDEQIRIILWSRGWAK